jgi:N-acetylmuramoyl-L-alanine amidase
MRKRWIPSPNWNRRGQARVDAVVLHYTALPLNDTIARFTDKNSLVSAHFVIDRDGSVIQMVRTEHRAWHAGASRLGKENDVNDVSIGIELVNWGPLRKKGDSFYVWKGNWSQRYQGEEPVRSGHDYWEPFTEEQYRALVELLRELRVHHPEITRNRIKGHSEVCLPGGRKQDPGGGFDWERVFEGVFA